MATVFKRKRKVKLDNGKEVVKQSLKYYTRLTDADGIKRTIPLFRDKTASQQRAAQLQKEIELTKAGIVDRYKEHRKRPLAKHLEDFRQYLQAKGDTSEYARLTVFRVKNIINGCKFLVWSDIQPSKVQRYIAGLRDGENGISTQTSNYYLQSIKQFCRWMVQDRRASESPLEHLKGLNVLTDQQHDRRALEPDELRRLLETVVSSPKRFGMDGYERYLLYRFAAETGLRANEIRSLKVGSFDFKNSTVKVEAGYSKRRRQDAIPLRPDTATQLKEFFKGKMPTVKAFGGTYKRLTKRTSDVIKADLADARIPYVDGAGRYADFHSLRHTTGSLLAASGVHPKVAQSLMRHSKIDLTMTRYTHVLRGQESEAVAKLPDLSLPSCTQQKATGTDDKSLESIQNRSGKLTPKLTPFLTPAAFPACNRSATVGNEQDDSEENYNGDNYRDEGKLDKESDQLATVGIDVGEMGRGGIEPPTHGFSVRCSTD